MISSFTITFISVLSFYASLCYSANARHLLAEEQTPTNYTLQNNTQHILSRYALRHINRYDYECFPPHFWDAIAPLLSSITDDNQVLDFQEFLFITNDFLAQNPAGLEAQKFFQFTRDRTVKEIIDILASYFNLKVPLFLRVYDFKTHNAHSPPVAVQITHFDRKLQSLHYVRSVSRDNDQIDALPYRYKQQTIWNIVMLPPDRCDLSAADLADGRFCCRLQNEHYENDRNYLRIGQDCTSLDCGGGDGPWTLLIAHVNGLQVELQSYHWNCFITICLDQHHPDSYKRMGLDKKSDAKRFILYEALKPKYPGISFRNPETQTWEAVMRIVDETNDAAPAREPDDEREAAEAIIAADIMARDVEIAAKLQAELEGDDGAASAAGAEDDHDHEPQLPPLDVMRAGASSLGHSGAGFGAGFSEFPQSGLDERQDDEQRAIDEELSIMKVVEEENELAKQQSSGAKPIPENEDVNKVRNGIAIQHRDRNRFLQTTGQKNIDCWADRISKSAIWIMEEIKRKDDGLYCKLRNSAVDPEKDRLAYLRFTDEEEIDLKGAGGPWNEFRIEPHGETLWKLFNVKWNRYLYVKGTNEVLAVASSDADGTLVRIVGDALLKM